MLDHTGLFIGATNHEARGVIHIEQRCAGLAAGLDEMRRLVCSGDIERPVIGDDSDSPALDASVAANRRGTIVCRKLGEIGIVYEARYRLPHIHGPLVVHW